MYIQTLTFLARSAGFVGNAVLRAGDGVFGLAIQHYCAKQACPPRWKLLLVYVEPLSGHTPET